MHPSCNLHRVRTAPVSTGHICSPGARPTVLHSSSWAWSRSALKPRLQCSRQASSEDGQPRHDPGVSDCGGNSDRSQEAGSNGNGKDLGSAGYLSCYQIGARKVVLPIALTILGLDVDAMSVRGHSLVHLCLDISQLFMTVLILRHCLKEFKPRQLGLFPMKLKGAWPLVVLACISIFPAVSWIAHKSLAWFHLDQEPYQLWHSVPMGDWITNGAYLAVLLVITPIWEEVIFRGFLLSSLSKYLPTPAAVLTSSLVFAICHFRLHLFVPHVLLGSVFSTIFLFCRNLLPAVVLHSGWNMFVLTSLLVRGA